MHIGIRLEADLKQVVWAPAERQLQCLHPDEGVDGRVTVTPPKLYTDCDHHQAYLHATRTTSPFLCDGPRIRVSVGGWLAGVRNRQETNGIHRRARIFGNMYHFEFEKHRNGTNRVWQQQLSCTHTYMQLQKQHTFSQASPLAMQRPTCSC